MKITHLIVSSGHYINITDHIGEMSIRTQNGTPEELQDHARELEEKAARLLRDATRLRTAAATSPLQAIDSRINGVVRRERV